MGAYPWPIRIVPTRWGRFTCAVCGLVVAGTIAALAHAAFERGRPLCDLGLHHWHLMTTARAGFVKFDRCSRGCGATRTRKGR